MVIKSISGKATQIDSDALLVGTFQGEHSLCGVTADIDEVLGGAISQRIDRGEFEGKDGEISIVHTLGKLPVRIVAIAGLGERAKFSVDKIRVAAGGASRDLRKLHCPRIAMALVGIGGIDPEISVEAMVQGAILGLYDFARYKKPESPDVEEILVVDTEDNQSARLDQGISRGKIVAEATNLARDMVNEPSNFMTPARIADVARGIAESQGIAVDILGPGDMEKMGMGALLGVARGSAEDPRLIVLSYQGDPDSKGSIGFVGKGVTFDSGGISIKPSKDMHEMKGDMAGAAAVLAAIGAISQLKLKVNVTAIVPAAENLPGGTALKPGDILRAMNGKTIEVLNTDAEGRLILADALSYAVTQGISPLIDLATLTGACYVALGNVYSGAFTNDQPFLDRVLKGASDAGERLWPMPMPEEYRTQIKSDIADIKNIGGRYGGAITAALFLKEFVGDVPWVHIDIAGKELSKENSGYLVKGATGVGVRTLVQLGMLLAK